MIKDIFKEFNDGFIKRLVLIILIIMIILLTVGIIKNYNQLDEESTGPSALTTINFNTDISFPYNEIEGAKKLKQLKLYDKAQKVLETHKEFQKALAHVVIPVEEMILTDIGTYYITGYTSIECGGSTMTASGATVHKGNPTTCAIDPALWDFGDLFYIPYFDQVYVAEDTGSAVKGKHLDLYFYDDEYNYALSITGYYKVYSVEYVTEYKQADYFNITDMVWEVQNGLDS